MMIVNSNSRQLIQAAMLKQTITSSGSSSAWTEEALHSWVIELKVGRAAVHEVAAARFCEVGHNRAGALWNKPASASHSRCGQPSRETTIPFHIRNRPFVTVHMTTNRQTTNKVPKGVVGNQR